MCISEFLSIHLWDHLFDRHERCPKKSGSSPFYFVPGSLEWFFIRPSNTLTVKLVLYWLLILSCTILNIRNSHYNFYSKLNTDGCDLLDNLRGTMKINQPLLVPVNPIKKWSLFVCLTMLRWISPARSRCQENDVIFLNHACSNTNLFLSD